MLEDVELYKAKHSISSKRLLSIAASVIENFESFLFKLKN